MTLPSTYYKETACPKVHRDACKRLLRRGESVLSGLAMRQAAWRLTFALIVAMDSTSTFIAVERKNTPAPFTDGVNARTHSQPSIAKSACFPMDLSPHLLRPPQILRRQMAVLRHRVICQPCSLLRLWSEGLKIGEGRGGQGYNSNSRIVIASVLRRCLDRVSGGEIPEISWSAPRFMLLFLLLMFSSLTALLSLSATRTSTPPTKAYWHSPRHWARQSLAPHLLTLLLHYPLRYTRTGRLRTVTRGAQSVSTMCVC